MVANARMYFILCNEYFWHTWTFFQMGIFSLSLLVEYTAVVASNHACQDQAVKHHRLFIMYWLLPDNHVDLLMYAFP